METLRVLNPVADKRPAHTGRPAKRVDGFDGKVIGVYDNRKPSGEVVLKRLTEHLTRRFQGVQVRRYIGSMGFRSVATAEDADRMAGECDAVIGVRAD